jgi:hypothetical protein
MIKAETYGASLASKESDSASYVQAKLEVNFPSKPPPTQEIVDKNHLPSLDNSEA